MQFDLHELELPVRLRTERPMTDDELMHFCAVNEVIRVERESTGELVLMSPAGGGTSHKNTWILYQMTRWAEEDGRGLTFDSNGGFMLPDGSMRSPDGAWVSWERWNTLAEADQRQFVPFCPEFVIELRSPSDRVSDLQAKMHMWLANGASVAWLIDPERKVVEIYRPGASPEVVDGASAVYGDGPVSGFVLELARIWG